MAYITTQSTIFNDVGVTAALRYFHKGSVSQLINYGSFLEQSLVLKNPNYGSWKALGGPLRFHGGAS